MKNILILVLLLGHFCCNIKKESDKNNKIVVGYVHAGNKIIEANDISAEKLTHINFAFANIVNGEIAEGYETDSANYAILNQLKKKNPDLKILVSVGGWSWSDGFSEIASDVQSRKTFIESSIRFILKHQLDGIDLDWEYPGLPGEGNPHKPIDKQNFTTLLEEFREALDILGKENEKYYMLTIAAGAFQLYADHVESEKIHPFLDYILLMTYDFSGEWDSITGHLTNLFSSEYLPESNSSDKAVEIFMKAGIPAEKLVLGMAFYGRGWRNVESVNNGLAQKGTGFNPGYTYKTISEKYTETKGYKRFFDTLAKAPFIYNADSLIFISYEDSNSIKYKCNYIIEKKLAGAMFWQYYGDYRNELLDAINSGLR
jgi:chitinase